MRIEGTLRRAFVLYRQVLHMKYIPILIFVLASVASGQEVRLYDPALDGQAQIEEAVRDAAAQQKHVLVQVGGNWCKWCKRLAATIEANPKLDSLLRADFVTVHLNFSKENKNEKALDGLGNPERFGFPVLVVLDADGNRLHTQDSALLEEGGGHDPEKVYRAMQLWTPKALKSGRR